MKTLLPSFVFFKLPYTESNQSEGPLSLHAGGEPSCIIYACMHVSGQNSDLQIAIQTWWEDWNTKL